MAQSSYKSGDVVWVMASKRLGWWPGRVENVGGLRQELAGDVTEKTIAVVKYLNEDNYQFVEDEAIICAYNSSQKEEYISLGMKKYFEKKRLNETSSTFMKFPNDVRQAEHLTGGNPNIVDDDKFQPKKPVPAQSKYKNIFVDPKAKDAKPKSPVKGNASPRRPGRPPTKNASPQIQVNHPRFQGQSDHEVRIRRQEKSPLSGSSGVGEYKCDSCAFQTARLNVMVIHQKTHLNNPSGSSTQQKSAQKRSGSPAKKTNTKRTKKNTEPDGDLFDQVKRNLEAKETGSSKSSPQSRTPSNKNNSTPRTPKTPKTSRSPRTPKTPTATSAVKTQTNKATETKTQFNPKKKWLKSLQKEANPEVKNKLMADWEEDEEETKPQEVAKPVSAEAKDLPVESDSDNEHRPSKSDLLHQRSDDEDDDDIVESETPISHDANKPVLNENDVSTAEESLAGISAEIDKLNADLDAVSHETRSSKMNGEFVNGETTELTATNGVESETCMPKTNGDEAMKQDVASLLAETSVPQLPDIAGLGKLGEVEKMLSNIPAEDEVKDDKATETVETVETVEKKSEPEAENGMPTVVENGVDASTVAENGEAANDGETVNDGSNILMQVEGGETYMVVWEPGSNIQEFLACGGEGDDGSSGATRTLLIDPSSLQAGSDLENLFQMAVAASAAPPQQNEQSNPTIPVDSKSGRRSTNGTPTKVRSGNNSKLKMAEKLLQVHGNAVNQELRSNQLVWALINSHLFVPGAVIESSNGKTLTLAAFNVDRPNNQRKFQRNRVIAAFNHKLNLELLTFGRTKNKAAVSAKLNLSYDHASSFSDLRCQDKFKDLTVHQYLVSCNRSPVKLFSDRYLSMSPVDELLDLPEPWLMDEPQSSDESVIGIDESTRRLDIVERMLDKHVLTDSCIQHLTELVKVPSSRLSLYESQSWAQLTRSATSGILENSRRLYSKLADFLHENVHHIRKLQEGKDHKRAFVLDFLLPEALIYGVQKTFDVTPQDAYKMVVYGLKSNDKPVIDHVLKC